MPPAESVVVVNQRRRVLVGLFLALAALAGAVLFEVLGTVFFAVTVAYVLAPLHDRLVARGVPSRVASAVATLGATVAALVPVGLTVYVIYRRRESILAFVADLPETVTVGVGGLGYTVSRAPLLASAREWLSTVAVELARALPTLALKVSVFGLVVFALLVRREEAGRALLAAVPREYHDVAAALNRRCRETLVAIYVLQVLTAAATFVAAVAVFSALGYPHVVTLAFVAAVLQFLPIVGPSVLVVALTGYELVVGDPLVAVLTLVLGLVFVGALPDLLVRPWFAREHADLPGSVYFVGFVGGLLTVGPVGVVAGPLSVALVAEGLGLLARSNAHGTAE
ncbi:MAG: AI-2E family transporter [Halobacteriaceae archaeon]